MGETMSSVYILYISGYMVQTCRHKIERLEIGDSVWRHVFIS